MYDLNFTHSNTSIIGWVPALDEIVNGVLGISLLLLVIIGCFIAFKKWDTVIAAGASGFIGFIWGLLLVWWGVLNWEFIFIPILIVVVAVVMEIFSN